MLPLEVVFDVPPAIVRGLATGALERVGGVIRETGSKQVVMWLREGGQLASSTDLPGTVLMTLLDSSTGGLASLSTGALNAAITAHSQYLIMQQLGRLETLLTISTGIGVVNLAVSSLSLAVLLKRLHALEKKIDGLYQHVTLEHRREMQAKLSAAISASRNAFDMKSATNKKQQAHNAIDRFGEVRDYILEDIQSLFKSSEKLEDRVEAVVHAMQIDSMLIRCHLELDELTSARSHLNEYVERYEADVHDLVGICLGDNREAYFLDTESIGKNDIYRFVAIEDWLHRSDSGWTNNNQDSPLMKVLDKYRISLRETKLKFGTKSRSYLKKVPGLKLAKREKPTELSYSDRLLQAEFLIEKLEGLQGFKAELDAIARLEMSHSQWQEHQQEALARAEINLSDERDYVFLADQDWLSKQSNSPAA